MLPTAVTIALPIADRKRSYAFSHDGLGFTAPGEPDKDGMPEPLRLTLGDHIRVMLIPRVGFGWVLGKRNRQPPVEASAFSAFPCRQAPTLTI